jgi:histidinol dehydrogenase
VRAFHAAQGAPALRVETAPGVICERISVPVRAVGLYVPAGSAPLPSTAIMLASPRPSPAVRYACMCTPPTRSGAADPAVLVAARKAGVTQVFKVGGAQAIAAMAYGTASIPKCDKLFGPGNAWVTAAKLLVANDADGAAADLPAGVSEVLVIADDGARRTSSPRISWRKPSTARKPRRCWSRTRSRWRRGRRPGAATNAILVARGNTARVRRQSAPDRRRFAGEAFAVSNDYAPEHLILEIRDAPFWLAA